MILLLSGCIFQLFNQRTTYLANEYLIEHPRIVGLSLQPPRIEPGQEYLTDALLAAPRDVTVQGWTLKTCALGRSVPTYIGDLNCFSDPSEVNILATGDSLPLSWTPPEIPVVDCPEWDTGREDTGEGEEDTGASDPPCAHSLPLLLEASVDGEPVMAAAWVEWFTEPSERPQPHALRDSRVVLELPETSRPGDTIDLEVFIEDDHREAHFFWYIDGGSLERTGWTSAQTWLTDSPEWPMGRTGSSNRWVLPDDAEGTLRLLVTIVPCAEDCTEERRDEVEYGLNMTWTQGSVEVLP